MCDAAKRASGQGLKDLRTNSEPIKEREDAGNCESVCVCVCVCACARMCWGVRGLVHGLVNLGGGMTGYSMDSNTFSSS